MFGVLFSFWSLVSILGCSSGKTPEWKIKLFISVFFLIVCWDIGYNIGRNWNVLFFGILAYLLFIISSLFTWYSCASVNRNTYQPLHLCGNCSAFTCHIEDHIWHINQFSNWFCYEQITIFLIILILENIFGYSKELSVFCIRFSVVCYETTKVVKLLYLFDLNVFNSQLINALLELCFATPNGVAKWNVGVPKIKFKHLKSLKNRGTQTWNLNLQKIFRWILVRN